MGKYIEYSSFLFAQPGFLFGAASALDIGGTLVEYNISKTPDEADCRAIASDWAIIGRHIYTSIQDVEKE